MICGRQVLMMLRLSHHSFCSMKIVCFSFPYLLKVLLIYAWNILYPCCCEVDYILVRFLCLIRQIYLFMTVLMLHLFWSNMLLKTGHHWIVIFLALLMVMALMQASLCKDIDPLFDFNAVGGIWNQEAKCAHISLCYWDHSLILDCFSQNKVKAEVCNGKQKSDEILPMFCGD